MTAHRVDQLGVRFPREVVSKIRETEDRQVAKGQHEDGPQSTVMLGDTDRILANAEQPRRVPRGQALTPGLDALRAECPLPL